MLKHIVIAIIVSLIAILAVHQSALLLHWLVYSHKVMSSLLGQIFSGGDIGALIRKTIALFMVPLIVALIPAGFYWGVTRKYFDYFPHVFWATWLLLFAVLVG